MSKTTQPALDHVVQAGDHEVIYPKNELRLRALVRSDGKSMVEDSAIKRADHALASLAGDFDQWMAEEVEKLAEAHRVYAASPVDPASQVDLFRQAHDMKGNAAILGYPLVGEAAHSLARLLDTLPPATVPLRLVENHVQSIRALASRAIHGPGNPIAIELVKELRSQTNPIVEEYLEKAQAGINASR